MSPKTTAMDEMVATVPELTCYVVGVDPPPIVPAGASRDWMDLTVQHYAYRCIPLSIANASGWEILCPFDIEVFWGGGSGKEDLVVSAREKTDRVGRLARSEFGHGILTFHLGYIFRTSPGWAIWARGAPNMAKPRIVPLEGLVETDWLPFTFTMNWRFVRTGRVRFSKDEPICFLTLAPHGLLDQVEPRLRKLDDDPKFAAAARAWAASRDDFKAKFAAQDPETVAEGWQRHYVRGEGATEGGVEFHITRRKLKPPRES
jgi:hypothetical protein